LKRTFADLGENIRVRRSGRSRAATNVRDKITGERLHPKVASWRSRPPADIAGESKLSFAHAHGAVTVRPEWKTGAEAPVEEVLIL
jgi:hypothetical protein